MQGQNNLSYLCFDLVIERVSRVGWVVTSVQLS